MAEIRQGYLDDYTQQSGKVGIGTSISNEKLEIIGGVTAQGLEVVGVATFVSASGFVKKQTNYVENAGISTGNSGTLSGEIVVGVGLTMIVENDVEAGQGSVDSLKVYDMFQPPAGVTAARPSGKLGDIFYNFDYKTIEFFDGQGWRQVEHRSTSGRGVFGGGQPALSGTYGDDYEYINISSGGNSIPFGELGLSTGQANCAGASNQTRGLLIGGSNPDANYLNYVDYISIQTNGKGISFGDLTERVSYVGALSSSTRACRVTGFVGTPASPTYYSNTIDFCEISTKGNFQDFADLNQVTYSPGTGSNGVRGLFAGGYVTPV